MRILALLFLLPWSAFAEAAAQSALMEELAQAESKWESQRLEDYSFTVSNSCSCPNPLHRGPLRIVVEQGRLRQAVYLGEGADGYSSGQAVRKRSPLRVTMPDLFRFIEQKLRRAGDNGADFKTKYDAKTGHLLRFEYADSESKDGKARLEVKDFKRLE